MYPAAHTRSTSGAGLRSRILDASLRNKDDTASGLGGEGLLLWLGEGEAQAAANLLQVVVRMWSEVQHPPPQPGEKASKRRTKEPGYLLLQQLTPREGCFEYDVVDVVFTGGAHYNGLKFKNESYNHFIVKQVMR